MLHTVYVKYVLQMDCEQTLKVSYQSGRFKCKMFADHSITAHQESTQANSVQLGTPPASPGLTGEQ